MKPSRHFFPLLLLAAMPASAVGQQYTKVVLKWDPVAGVKGYNAYRCANSTPSSCTTRLNASLIEAPTTTYTDNAGLAQNTWYYYGVKSVDMSGRESEQFSNIAPVWFGPPPR